MANTVEIVIKGVDQASGPIRGVRGSLGGLGESLRGAGAQMMGLGAKMTAGVSAPLGLLGAQAAHTAGDFEAAMNILAIAARQSGTPMEDLSKAAIAVGKDVDLVGIDAMEAAGAMTTFYKAGLDTSDIFSDLQGYIGGTTPLMGALRAAIDLAAASDLDLAGASDVVAVAMATFGLNAEDAVRIADSFVGAADASVAEVSDLADALKNVGPTAAQFGYSLEDTNTALAILSTRGIKGSEAGTALKSMMTNLMRPTSKVIGMLKELNVELYDQEGALKPLPTIIDELGGAMAGLSEEEKNIAIQTLAGTYGMKAMATLLDEGKEGWDAMSGAMAGAASAQEVAGARTQGFNAAMEQLQGAIQTFMIVAATPFIQDVLTPLVQKLQGVIEWLISLDPELLNLGLLIGAVAVAAGPLLLALGAITTALGAILSPIGLVVGAIALLALAWATNFGGIRDFTMGVWAEIQTVIQTVIDTIKPYIEDLVVTVRAWFEENWPRIQAIFETVWGVIQTIIETVVPLIVDFIREEFGIIIGWVQENWPLIKETIETILNAILVVVETVVGFISRFWQEHHQTIETVANTIWENVKSTIDTIIHTILDILKAVMQLITGDWEGAWETVRGAAQRIWEWLQGVWEETLKAIRAVLDDILPKLQDFWETTWDSIQGKVSDVWDAIWGKVRDAVGEIADKLWRGFNTIKDFLKGIWDGIFEAFKGTFDDMIQKAEDAGKGIMRALKDAMGSIKIPMPTFSVEWRPGPLGIKVPDLKLGVNWRALRDLVPWLAEGGIALRPTLAMIGEAGPEAVIPLSGGRARAAGLNFDGRVVTLLTEIRDLVASGAGVDSSRFAYSDMMWDLQAAQS